MPELVKALSQTLKDGFGQWKRGSFKSGKPRGEDDSEILTQTNDGQCCQYNGWRRRCQSHNKHGIWPHMGNPSSRHWWTLIRVTVSICLSPYLYKLQSSYNFLMGTFVTILELQSLYIFQYAIDYNGMSSSEGWNDQSQENSPQAGTLFQMLYCQLYIIGRLQSFFVMGLPRWLSNKDYVCQCRRHKRQRFNPWVSASLFCQENPVEMDRGAWQATIHGTAKSRTWLKQLNTHIIFLFHVSQTPNEFVDSYFVHEEIKALTYSIFKDIRNNHSLAKLRGSHSPNAKNKNEHSSEVTQPKIKTTWPGHEKLHSRTCGLKLSNWEHVTEEERKAKCLFNKLNQSLSNYVFSKLNISQNVLFSMPITNERLWEEQLQRKTNFI